MGDHRVKLDRDRPRVMQLKTDQQHREEAQEQEPNAPAPDNRGGCRKEDQDNFDPHYKEGTQEDKATQRTPPKALLESARKGQEAETLVGRGV